MLSQPLSIAPSRSGLVSVSLPVAYASLVANRYGLDSPPRPASFYEAPDETARIAAEEARAGLEYEMGLAQEGHDEEE